MKKVVALLVLGGFMALNILGSPAQAFPPFKKAFGEKYVDNSTDANFKAAFAKASCGVCHAAGPKTNRNAYGKELAKITGGHVKKDMDAAQGDDAKKAVMDKALKDLADAFDKVEKEKAPSGKTFGETIQAGKLPASK